MAIDKITSASITTDAVGPTQLNEASNYDFTGTVTGAGASNKPSFFALKSSSINQDIATNTNTKVTFDSETWDEGSGFDLTNNKFVVPSGEGGKYYLNFTCRTYDASSKIYSVRQQIYKNGSAASNNEFYGGGSDAFEMEGTCFTHSIIMDLSASDYLECYITCKTHDSGNILILGDATTRKTYFTGYKLF